MSIRQVGQQIIKNPGVALFSLPGAIPAALAAGANVLEHSTANRVVKAFAWGANRSFTVLAAIGGIALLVYSILKTMVLSGVNTITRGKKPAIVKLADNANIQNNRITVGYGLGLVALTQLDLKKSYTTYNQQSPLGWDHTVSFILGELQSVGNRLGLANISQQFSTIQQGVTALSQLGQNNANVALLFNGKPDPSTVATAAQQVTNHPQVQKLLGLFKTGVAKVTP